MISPTKRFLPDNTQHSQKKDIDAPAKFGPGTPVTERPQNHTLDRAATRTVADQGYSEHI